MVHANSVARAVQGLGRQTLDCWDSGFESRREQRCFVFVVSSVGSGFFNEMITLAEESYRVFMCTYLIVRHLEISEVAWA